MNNNDFYVPGDGNSAPDEVITSILDNLSNLATEEDDRLLIDYSELIDFLWTDFSISEPEQIIVVASNLYAALRERSRAPTLFTHEDLGCSIINKREFTEAILCIPTLLKYFPSKKAKEADAIDLLTEFYTDKDREELSIFINRALVACNILQISFTLVPEVCEEIIYEPDFELDINQFGDITNSNIRAKRIIYYSRHRRERMLKSEFDKCTEKILDEYYGCLSSDAKKKAVEKLIVHFAYLVGKKNVENEIINKEDYFQEYSLTVSEAIKKYTRGEGPFENYLSRSVVNNMKTFFSKNSSEFNISKTSYLRRCKIDAAVKEYVEENRRYPDAQEIMKVTGFSYEDVVLYTANHTVSMEQKFNEEDSRSRAKYEPSSVDKELLRIGEKEALRDILNGAGLSDFQKFMVIQYCLVPDDDRESIETLAQRACELGLTKSPKYSNAQSAKTKGLNAIKKYMVKHDLL